MEDSIEIQDDGTATKTVSYTQDELRGFMDSAKQFLDAAVARASVRAEEDHQNVDALTSTYDFWKKKVAESEIKSSGAA